MKGSTDFFPLALSPVPHLSCYNWPMPCHFPVCTQIHAFLLPHSAHISRSWNLKMTLSGFIFPQRFEFVLANGRNCRETGGQEERGLCLLPPPQHHIAVPAGALNPLEGSSGPVASSPYFQVQPGGPSCLKPQKSPPLLPLDGGGSWTLARPSPFLLPALDWQALPASVNSELPHFPLLLCN